MWYVYTQSYKIFSSFRTRSGRLPRMIVMTLGTHRNRLLLIILQQKVFNLWFFFYVTLWRTVQIWRDLPEWRVHYLGSIGLRRRSPVLIEILSKKSACLQKLYHKRASTKHIHINVKLPDQEPCPHDELGPFCQRTWQYPVTQCQSSYPWALYYLVVQLSLHDVVPVLQKAS